MTESVLRQIRKPVVTVGPQVRLSPKLDRIERVSCPVDYSDRDRAALERPAALAQTLGAELIVGLVLEGGGIPNDQARQALCDWVPVDVRRECSMREVVRQGNTAEQILLEAKDSRADLMVIGANPRNVLGAL